MSGMNAPVEGLVWPLSDRPLCSKPHGGQALRGPCGWWALIKFLSWGPAERVNSKDRDGGHKSGGVALHVAQGPESGVVLPDWAAPPGRGKRRWSAGRAIGVRVAVGPGICRAGRLVHWSLLQGRILLGPEGVPLRRVDVLASNGVIHMLEGVLLPPTILPILPKLCSEEQHQIVAVSCRLTCGPGPTCSPPAGGKAAGGPRPGPWPHAPTCLPQRQALAVSLVVPLRSLPHLLVHRSCPLLRLPHSRTQPFPMARPSPLLFLFCSGPLVVDSLIPQALAPGPFPSICWINKP